MELIKYILRYSVGRTIPQGQGETGQALRPGCIRTFPHQEGERPDRLSTRVGFGLPCIREGSISDEKKDCTVQTDLSCTQTGDFLGQICERSLPPPGGLSCEGVQGQFHHNQLRPGSV